jgi:hypothetical protein
VLILAGKVTVIVDNSVIETDRFEQLDTAAWAHFRLRGESSEDEEREEIGVENGRRESGWNE